MENHNIKKATPFNVVQILEYQPQSIVVKSILRKTTGNLSAFSFDSGEVLTGKISPFDTFLQIIDDKSNLLEIGQSIIIPAHSSNTIKAHQRFKMLSTIIKYGYEDITLKVSLILFGFVLPIFSFLSLANSYPKGLV